MDMAQFSGSRKKSECLLKISRLDQSSFILAIFALFSLIVPLLNAFASL